MIPQSRLSGQIRKIKSVAQKTLDVEKAKRRAKQRSLPFAPTDYDSARQRLIAWFRDQGFTPSPFQTKAWDAFAANRAALIAVPTGSGKTLAAFGGPLIKLMTDPRPTQSVTRIIYLTPLKALARDIVAAAERPIHELKLPFEVGLRTGDTSSADRQALRKNNPEILVTTPESLAILLTGSDTKKFSHVFSVVVDEGHELLGSKRGSLLELSIATLRQYAPNLLVTVLSATIGNLQQAAEALTGVPDPILITDAKSRDIRLEVLTPPEMSAAPWFGYAGLNLSEELLKTVDPEESQIIFTNTRGSAEAWFRDIIERRPEWRGITALHHGSLTREERAQVEADAKSGKLRIIVATSSLELGVDFPKVGRIYQIGSVKSMARAVQRAGRGFHRPGESSFLTVCPSSIFEILEAHALRQAVKVGVFEDKIPVHKPLDVFVQFLLNRAYNEGFTIEEIKATVARTYSFRDINDEEINWALQFLISGGASLSHYAQFLKIHKIGSRYLFADAKLARLHRMNIGTIVSDDGIRVRFTTGKTLGSIGETFVSRLKKGDVFQFAGRELEYVNLNYNTLIVRMATERPEVGTVWNGNILPISSLISEHLRQTVDQLAKATSEADVTDQELKDFWAAAEKQKEISHIPKADETLIEIRKAREGYHLYIYTWAGRLVNEGLGHLFAFRIAQVRANTISVSVSDHGIELLASEAFPPTEVLQSLFSDLQDLESDIEKSLNFPELSKRTFREVARVSGLIQATIAGQTKNQRNLQMSSGLLYDVFEKYEKNHPLVNQAKKEIRQNQLHLPSLIKVIKSFQTTKFVFKETKKLSPFGFPLFIERSRTRISTEKLEHRIARFQRQILEDT